MTTAGPEMSGVPEAPPPFRLRYPGHELVLRPYSWCYTNGCVDGAPTNPPSVGSPDEIRIHVPEAHWALTASFSPAGKRCGRQQSVELDRAADGWFILRPAGHADRYDVSLFAHGGGDMAASFQWTTPSDGPLPTPAARLAVLAGHDGELDSYGVELTLENLAATPVSASAHVTVTAANGESVGFDATQAHQRCFPEGTIYFDGPDDPGKAAAALGPGPFTYAVDAVLDGAIFRASAQYPRDVIQGDEPSVTLTFEPELPALR